MTEIRKASCNEHLYMDMQDLTNSYAIQYLFKIKKLKSKEKLEEAINSVIKNNKGSNVYLKGNKYYLNNKYLKIKEIKDDNADIYNLKVFQSKVDYTKESIKVYIINNNGNKYLYFQLLHSVMDGKGCLLFVENVMNYLKEKDLIKCSNDITEKEFVKPLKYNKNNENKLPNIKHPKAKPINKYITKWKVIELDGYVPSLISKIACILNKEFNSSLVKYMIPTDIRRHNRKDTYIGNLTLPIFLKVKDSDNYQNVNGQLLYSIKNNEELNIKHASYINYEYYPKTLRKLVLKQGLNIISKYNKFTVGAIISHLGRIDLKDYSNKHLEVDEFVSLPVQQPLGAFSIVIAEYNNKTKIAMSYYESQFEEEYVESLLNNIKAELFNNCYDFNNTAKKLDYNYINLLQQIFKENENEIAVDDGNKKYTYNELKENINKYLAYFKKQKIKSQDTIILFLDRGFEYISASIACILSGIIFIPIDKTITKDRLETIIKISNYKTIISEKVVSELEKYNVSVLENIKKVKSIENIEFKYIENNVVYKIYTSGTTGIPKCVPITSKNLNNYILWCKETYKTTKKMIMPLYTSLSVDLTITSTFLPIICGGTIKTYKEIFNPSIFKKIINDPEINVIKGTPTHFSFITNNKNVNNKEILIIGGEQLTVNMCEKLTDILGESCKIVNEYGPTETTVGCTYYTYNKNCKNVVPIGKPIFNTKVLVYDNKIIREENKIGELLVSGDSVFNGYLGIDNNCFIEIDNEKYYKTGDAVYIKDNNLYYVERIDSQVKIRGNRVELDEIKNAINNISGIDDCAVLYKDNIYAYIITNKKIKAEDIKQILRKILPNYMIPSEIHFLKSLPILPGGKIDKNKLLSLNSTKKSNKQIEYDDELSNILLSIKSDLVIDKEKTLFELGLESFDIINFIQILVEKYIKEEKEEEFVTSLIENINNISLKDVEREIMKFGDKL